MKRINALFGIGRDINGRPAAERLAIRQELSAPCVAELENGLGVSNYRQPSCWRPLEATIARRADGEFKFRHQQQQQQQQLAWAVPSSQKDARASLAKRATWLTSDDDGAIT
jgi:hypothetical protein